MTKYLIPLLITSASAFATPPDEWEEWPEEQEGDTWEVQSPWSEPLIFTEWLYGQRLQNDKVINSRNTVADWRFQSQLDYQFSDSKISSRINGYYSGVTESFELQVRELAWQGQVSEKWDVKAGQQVLTWGTGDYVFINDLFAKDWQSFFNGRDDEYLKAPSFSVKASGYFANDVSIDLVYTPTFTADTHIQGDYFSYFQPMFAMQNGIDNGHSSENFSTDDSDINGEYAARLSWKQGSREWAGYLYHGAEKTPSSANSMGQPKYSPLTVAGASVITNLAGGLFKAEYGYYYSHDDTSGTNPFISNSQQKFLLGYERELITNLTGSVQWYLEHTEDHQQLMAKSPWPQWENKENRQLITGQLHQRLMQDKLVLRWFGFYSPTDKDSFQKLKLSYQWSDQLTVGVAANIFSGESPHSFFGQFETASNMAVNLRYYF